MAYSAELIIYGETYTANIIKGSPGDTGPKGADGVAIVPVFNDGVKLVDQFSVLKFTGGGKILTNSGNDITVNIPTATNDYTQLINKPDLFSGAYADLTGAPVLFSGSYTDLTNKPTIPVDINQLADSSGILAANVFDGSYNSLSDLPSLFNGQYSSLIGLPVLFDGNYNSLSNKPTLFSESYNDLTDKPDLAALDYVTPSTLTSTLNSYVTTLVLTSTLNGYVQTATLSDYVTNTSLSNTLSSTLSSYVLTTTLNSGFVSNTTLAGYEFATQSFVGNAIAQLVDTAPEALNTLNELAAALGDDANFSTTVTNSIGLKANSADLAAVATSGSYTDLSDKPSSGQITETSNLYYTDARVQAKLGNVSGNIIPDTTETYDLGSPTARFKDIHLSGNSIYLGNNLILFNDAGKFSARDYLNNPVTISLANNNTGDITEGPTNLYYTTARANTDFNTHLGTKTTSDLAEGDNLYWTVSRG